MAVKRGSGDPLEASEEKRGSGDPLEASEEKRGSDDPLEAGGWRSNADLAIRLKPVNGGQTQIWRSA
ncbi:MAG TPA: hypothetical protein PLJ78_05225 [Anaerolineae bacterium]|nr:hypothetical protein [Anaerolineae bacterium]HQK13332.1 hypothetical protein [Anaerolineae bacterium]